MRPSIFSYKSVGYVHQEPTQHPLSDRYGLTLTAIAAWRVNISHTQGASGQNPSVQNQLSISKLKVKRHQKFTSLLAFTTTHIHANSQQFLISIFFQFLQ